MHQKEISTARIASQHIAGTRFKTARELLSWMGAMQAQDFKMVQWAIGARIPGISASSVLRALDSGDLIRTHVLRPTWHVTTAEDVKWMLDLTAPHLQAGARTRHKQLELTESVLARSLKVITKELRDGNHRTRQQLFAALERNKIETADQRGVFILLHAELEKVVCSGKRSGAKNTYALFDERVKSARALTRDEALVRLASRYFASRGPATVNDFSWWSGLSLTDARKAVRLSENAFQKDTINGETYWYGDIPRKTPQKTSLHLLPAFDEFMIAYKDRSACLPQTVERTVISRNGIFWPVVLVNGMVTGTWRRRAAGKDRKIEVEFFPGVKVRYSRRVLTQREQEISRFFNADELAETVADGLPDTT